MRILAAPNPQPGRERLRYLVIGSPEGVRGRLVSDQSFNPANQDLWPFSQLLGDGRWPLFDHCNLTRHYCEIELADTLHWLRHYQIV